MVLSANVPSPAQVTHSATIVLHVEDNPADRKLVMAALLQTPQAPRIFQVATSEEAIAFLRREAGYERAPRPHLILLDLELPQRDGCELLRALQSDAGLATIAVVMFSGLVYAEALFKEFRQQVREFIAKPEHAQGSLDLAERIGALLPGPCALGTRAF